MGSCKANSPVPWEKNSIVIMKDANCLRDISDYSIRVHKSARPHFDYAVGNPNDDACIDFVIPKTNTTVETTGIPILPKVQVLLLLMPVHEISFLNGEVGKVNVIEEGEYGAGTWWIVKKGKARMEQTSKTLWHLCFDDDQYTILEFKRAGGSKYYNIRPSKTITGMCKR